MSASTRRHVYLEDRHIGDYVADVRVLDVLDSAPRDAPFTLTLNDLYLLQLHVGNAIRSLNERKIVDAVCGDCDECGNVRMIQVERGGRSDWIENCPVCRPKIEAWRAADGVHDRSPHARRSTKGK